MSSTDLPAGSAWLAGASRVGWVPDLLGQTAHAGPDAGAGLALAEEYGRRLPIPSAGATPLRWQILAAVGAADLTGARTLEAHSDALAILAEAGDPVPDRMGSLLRRSTNIRLTGRNDRAGWAVEARNHGAPWGAPRPCH